MFLHIIFYGIILFFLILLVKDMVKEKVQRGILVFGSALLLWIILGVLVISFSLWKLFLGVEMIFLIFMIIMLIPDKKYFQNNPFPIPGERVDERDVMFARAARKPGTKSYNIYYNQLRPHLKKIDDHLRNLPGLCHPESLFYQKELMEKADWYFEEIERIQVDQKTIASFVKKMQQSVNPTRMLKKIIHELGAIDVGVAPLLKSFVYTYKGRFDYNYGEKIQINHPFIIVFLVEMDFENMRRAPFAETIMESAKQYYRAAKIAKYVEALLLELGYQAKAQYDAHYDVILPPLAVLAGLGEIGRNNILISRKWGSRVRIGGVTTDFPLTEDSPIYLNVEKFCRICKKCATSCPSRSLSTEKKGIERGVLKWYTKVESCYGYWRRIGTDCGICMVHCPYSKPNTFLHNLTRKWISFSSFFPYVALFLDDWIYGKNWETGKNISLKLRETNDSLQRI